LRQADNDAEALLWSELRGRRLNGFKFVRQLSIGPYFADFACREKMLVIEVDGPSHANPEQADFDAQRTRDLERWGWRVVRIANADVFAGGDGLYDFLDRALKGE
jgi:very-short-patch-repair endonuclease